MDEQASGRGGSLLTSVAPAKAIWPLWQELTCGLPTENIIILKEYIY